MSYSCSAARGNEDLSSLPLLWQQSIIDNAREQAERDLAQRRRKTLYFSVVTALVTGAMARPAVVQATDYKGSVTGVADNDRDGGSGGYDPGYDITTDGKGALHYRFADGDSVALEGVDRDVLAMSIAGGNPPVVVDVAGGGWLDLSANRPQSTNRGLAVGILNDGNTVTVNGNTRISANARDTDHGGGLGNGAHAVIGRGGSTTVFNGATDFHARTQGFARAVWAMGRSNIVFNGPTTILAESRGTLDAVYNSDGSHITFNGKTAISALSIWPSDNAHAIYNDNVNTRLVVNGDLSLTTVAQGSTAFGVRNQGFMEVAGDASVNVEGTRSTHGIANTHRSARMIWHGDVDVRVRSSTGYVPFGNPSGLSNDRSPGAVMTYNGAVNVDIASRAETYGLVSTGTINFTSPTAPVSFAVASGCDGCDVYGIRNFGTVNVAGGLTVSTAATGAGAAYSIWSVPLDIQNASVAVNQAGGQKVQLDGDILTASDAANGRVGSADIEFDTADSWLRGGVVGRRTDGGYSVGRTELAFSGGAAWIPEGTGTLSNDFGAGSLTIGSNGAIDMAGHWGRFEPGAVPAHAYRRLLVDSSNTGTGASVVLADGARFMLLSDITGKSGTATADQIVFGSGIKNFSASGTQGVGIVYDPVLDDTSWVNAAAIRDGRSIAATAPITIVDASAAAGGTAAFSAATGLDGRWSGTYENDLVQFTYTPQVALAADGKKIVLTGLKIVGTGSGTGGNPGGSPGGNPGGDPGGGTGGNAGGGTGGNTGGGTGGNPGGGANNGNGNGSGTSIGILPSQTVLTAADAADSLANLWKVSAQSSLQHVRNQLRDTDADHGQVWAKADAGEITAKTAYSRRYRQNYSGMTIGADRSFAPGTGTGVIGFSAGQVRSTADYVRGRGDLSGTTLGLYGHWSTDNGNYLLLGASASSLKSRYAARDIEGRDIVGKYRTQAGQLYAEGGRTFKLAKSYYIEPQFGLSLGAIRDSEHTTRNGVRISQDKLDTSFARVGIALGRRLQGARLDGNIYARASALHSFGDNLDIVASKDGGSIAPDTADRKGTSGEFMLGGDVGFGNKQTALFFEASGATGVETERHWAIQAGLRHSW
ncbi:MULTISPECIES: autotransporter outer membrane beta-barrel domain-containing protein [unclassified Lysobacter]|uniref:autotransporter outer membrane beta-barrel domain-containing protein n=1 Tax=unclassified Lysobacter TaxID=2635362 RepID=UPI001BE63926|nr:MULTISPECIES: autotransporter outer membrane beta-barrel domain-containing protein [unclassified Lysobacter]MBT2748732.1 autotransporter outer membrane beta-barrel domain-containing protein [Lysobacter sp. ISL-42]MBT2751667.1 autotransporter outer membrane beta-barrel domain-containing protein [Lysobacter sp. ISL-50]MBT2775861.1 autotransporter outer membrane beta-barrel domain-containing protein [Lysobacter sp. ISL-54]MBT2782175.1 autotransporter outer membrane beta-barrel domain-containing